VRARERAASLHTNGTPTTQSADAWKRFHPYQGKAGKISNREGVCFPAHTSSPTPTPQVQLQRRKEKKLYQVKIKLSGNLRLQQASQYPSAGAPESFPFAREKERKPQSDTPACARKKRKKKKKKGIFFRKK